MLVDHFATGLYSIQAESDGKKRHGSFIKNRIVHSLDPPDNCLLVRRFLITENVWLKYFSSHDFKAI